MRHVATPFLTTIAVLTGMLWAGSRTQAQNAISSGAISSGNVAQKNASQKEHAEKEKSAKAGKVNREGKKKAPQPVPAQKAQVPETRLQPEHEVQALAFARNHHTELADLLEQLKQNSAAEYGKAMQDLYRTADRLAKLHDRDLERYPLELDLWKIESRIRLLTAQLLMGGSVSLEADLKGLIVQRLELRSRILQMDRERATQRIVAIDRELETYRADPEAAAVRELDRLKKNATKVARPAPQKSATEPVDSKKGNEKDKKRRSDSKPTTDK